MQTILELKDVSYTYPGNIVALDNFSATFTLGRRTAVLGRNGSGKTTLFSLLNGLLKPQKGEILINGAPIRYDRHSLMKLRQDIGMVFQNPDSQLFSACIYEDISFGPINLGLSETEVRNRVEISMLQMKLKGLENRPTHMLSYGQKKRACIAGVLAMNPQVLILDEPFAGLDPVMTTEFVNILDQLHNGGTSLIVATHDLDQAYAWADEAIIISNGRLLAQGAAIELLQQREIHDELGAAPLVAEVCTALDIFNGLPIRTSEDLIAVLLKQSRQENNP